MQAPHTILVGEVTAPYQGSRHIADVVRIAFGSKTGLAYCPANWASVSSRGFVGVDDTRPGALTAVL